MKLPHKYIFIFRLYQVVRMAGFPVMEVGIETEKIIKNERKEKNLRNSYFGHGYVENFRCPRIRPA